MYIYSLLTRSFTTKIQNAIESNLKANPLLTLHSSVIIPTIY